MIMMMMMMGLVVTSSICSCSVTAPILSSRPTCVKWHWYCYYYYFLYSALLTPSDFSDRENLFWWNDDSDLLFSPLLRRLWTTFLQLFLLISGRDHSQCYDSSKIVLKKQHLYIRVHIASWQNVVAHCERPDISKDVDVGLPQARQAGPALPGPRQDGGLCGDRHDHDRAERVVGHLWWFSSAPQKSNFKQCELWWSNLEPNTIIKIMMFE